MIKHIKPVLFKIDKEQGKDYNSIITFFKQHGFTTIEFDNKTAEINEILKEDWDFLVLDMCIQDKYTLLLKNMDMLDKEEITEFIFNCKWES